MSSALSASAEQNWAAISGWKPRGMCRAPDPGGRAAAGSLTGASTYQCANTSSAMPKAVLAPVPLVTLTRRVALSGASIRQLRSCDEG